MKRYLNETEKAVALAKAQSKIAEFLKHDYSYTELMTKTAKAQAQVFSIISAPRIQTLLTPPTETN